MSAFHKYGVGDYLWQIHYLGPRYVEITELEDEAPHGMPWYKVMVHDPVMTYDEAAERDLCTDKQEALTRSLDRNENYVATVAGTIQKSLEGQQKALVAQKEMRQKRNELLFEKLKGIHR
jgi:hypothetical protein